MATKKSSLADTPLIDKRPRVKKPSAREVARLEKRDDERRKKNRAVWLQLFIDEHYGLDIASFQTGELSDLAAKITEFASLGVETEDLKEAGDYTDEDATKAGYRP